MRSVLLDNMSIGKFTKEYISTNKPLDKSDIAIQNYFYALVFWDKIYTVTNRSSFRRRPTEISDKKLHIYPLKFDSRTIDDNMDHYIQEFFDKNSAFTLDETTLRDVFYYHIVSLNNDLNYFLGDKRAQLVSELNLKKHSEPSVRLLFPQQLEIDARSYYETKSAQYNTNIKLKSPLLIDYILRETTNCREAFDLAKDLRNKPSIQDYRNTMERLEQNLKSGEYKQVDSISETLTNMAKAITKTTNSKPIDITIGLTAGFAPFTVLPYLESSLRFNLPSPNALKNRIQLRFLVDLRKYAFKEWGHS